MEIVYDTDQSYLQHHGIKGQHWGVRRYQNKDGTLTELGKKKYGTINNFNKHRQMQRERNLKIVKGVAKAAITTAAVGAGGYLVKRALRSVGENLASNVLSNTLSLESDHGSIFSGYAHPNRPHTTNKNRDSLLNSLMGYFAGTGQISPGTSGDMFTQMLSGKPHHASASNVSIQGMRQNKPGGNIVVNRTERKGR